MSEWTQYNYAWRNVVVTDVSWEHEYVRWSFVDELGLRKFSMKGYDIDANWDIAHIKMAMDRYMAQEFIALKETDLATYWGRHVLTYVQDMFKHPYEMPDY